MKRKKFRWSRETSVKHSMLVYRDHTAVVLPAPMGGWGWQIWRLDDLLLEQEDYPSKEVAKRAAKKMLHSIVTPNSIKFLTGKDVP